MAEFNPEVPQVYEQNYLGWAKGVKQPEPSKTGEALYGSAGHILESGIKAADFVNKNALEDKMYSAIDAKRDAWTAQLENVYDAAKAGGPGSLNPANAGKAGATSNVVYGQGTVNTNNVLTASPGAPAPASLTGDFNNAADRLEAAKASGKYSKTYIDNQYNILAKDFRARYPQYREFIDKKFEEITGENPANAYAKSLLSDINSYAAKANDETKQITTALIHAASSGNTAAVDILKGHQAGTYSNTDALGRLSATMAGEWQHKQNAAALSDLKGSLERQQIFASRVLPDNLRALAKNNLANLTMTEPIVDEKTGAVTPGRTRNMTEYLLNTLAGNEKPTDQMWTLLSQKVHGDRIATDLAIDKRLDETTPEGGSYRVALGPDKAAQFKADALGHHDALLKAIDNKDTGLAYATSRLITAKGHDALLGLYTNKGGEQALLMGTIAQMRSPEFFKAMYQRIANSNLERFDKEALNIMTTQIQSRNQFDPRLNPNEPAMPLSQPLEAAKKDGLSSKGANYFAIEHVPGLLADPKQPILEKAELARNSFDPKNSNYIGNFKPSFINEKGERVPGREDVWNGMTQEGVTKEMLNVSKITGDKTIWSNYKNWAEDQFGRVLFRDDVAKLNNIFAQEESTRGVKIKFTPGEGNQAPRWEFERNLTPEFARSQGALGVATHWADVKRFENRFNIGLSNLSNIAKVEGSNINAYVVNLLTGVSGNMNPEMHKMLMDSIRASVPQKTETKTKPETQITEAPTRPEGVPPHAKWRPDLDEGLWVTRGSSGFLEGIWDKQGKDLLK